MLRSFRYTPAFAAIALVAAALGAPALATEESRETLPTEAAVQAPAADPHQEAEKARVAQAWQEVVTSASTTQTASKPAPQSR